MQIPGRTEVSIRTRIRTLQSLQGTLGSSKTLSISGSWPYSLSIHSHYSCIHVYIDPSQKQKSKLLTKSSKAIVDDEDDVDDVSVSFPSSVSDITKNEDIYTSTPLINSSLLSSYANKITCDGKTTIFAYLNDNDDDSCDFIENHQLFSDHSETTTSEEVNRNRSLSCVNDLDLLTKFNDFNSPSPKETSSKGGKKKRKKYSTAVPKLVSKIDPTIEAILGLKKLKTSVNDEFVDQDMYDSMHEAPKSEISDISNPDFLVDSQDKILQG